MGREEGQEEGREEGSLTELRNVIEIGLDQRYGKKSKSLARSLQKITDITKLRAIYKALWKAEKMEDIKQFILDSQGS